MPRRAREGHRPAGYPAGCEEDVQLEDGRMVHIRPVVPGDVTELAAAVAHADRDTLRRRFLGGAPPTGTAALARLVTVDYVRRFALVAFDPEGHGVGVARYEGATTWPAVELAVTVDPAWRGVGLGRALVTRVARHAALQGARELDADFYVDNQQVQGLLMEAGLPEQRTSHQGVVTDHIPLDESAVTRLTRQPG